MRTLLFSLCVLLCSLSPATAQVSLGIGFPGISIAITVPAYPQLVRVPGYPVYYAPQINANYFFYDGMYWVYHGDNWYASTWYNGPWQLVEPDAVPLYVLRVPVRYYRHPPPYFRGWRADAPPRWGEHWGNDWQQRHSGWDRWNRNAAPVPAPLPSYQRQYSGNRYPHAEQQQSLHERSYRYQPRDDAVRQRYQVPRTQPQQTPAPRAQGAPREMRSPQPNQAQPGRAAGGEAGMGAPPRERERQAPQPQQAAPQRERDKGQRGSGERDKAEQRGGEHNK